MWTVPVAARIFIFEAVNRFMKEILGGHGDILGASRCINLFFQSLNNNKNIGIVMIVDKWSNRVQISLIFWDIFEKQGYIYRSWVRIKSIKGWGRGGGIPS